MSEKAKSVCERCQKPVKDGPYGLTGCEQCGLMFGECCVNSVDENYCEMCGPD